MHEGRVVLAVYVLYPVILAGDADVMVKECGTLREGWHKGCARIWPVVLPKELSMNCKVGGVVARIHRFNMVMYEGFLEICR